MSMMEAFEKVGLKSNDFEDREVNEEEIKIDLRITFLEKWLKMLERNASEKEKYNFIIKQGFLSVQHFNLYCSILDDVILLKDKLEDEQEFMTLSEIRDAELKLKDLESKCEAMKHITYYKSIMRYMGKRDISPYGVDLIKNKIVYHN